MTLGREKECLFKNRTLDIEASTNAVPMMLILKPAKDGQAPKLCTVVDL
jgi:hypothetical protein